MMFVRFIFFSFSSLFDSRHEPTYSFQSTWKDLLHILYILSNAFCTAKGSKFSWKDRKDLLRKKKKSFSSTFVSSLKRNVAHFSGTSHLKWIKRARSRNCRWPVSSFLLFHLLRNLQCLCACVLINARWVPHKPNTCTPNSI